MKKYSDLNENAKDVLMEIGNIGTGNAITSLSSMMGRQIDMERPTVQITGFNDIPEVFGGMEDIQVGVLLEISGELNGMFMFLISGPFAKVMLKELVGAEPEFITDIDEMGLSAVQEIGNIMCCSYINALSMLMNLKVHVSVPGVCIDMTGAILSAPMIHFAKLSDELLLIEDRYHFDNMSVVSHVLFLPEIDSLERIFEALGEEYEG